MESKSSNKWGKKREERERRVLYHAEETTDEKTIDKRKTYGTI